MALDIESASELKGKEAGYDSIFHWRPYVPAETPKKKRKRPNSDCKKKRKKKKKNKRDIEEYDIYNTIWRGGSLVTFSEEEEKQMELECKKQVWWQYRHCGGDPIEKVRSVVQMSKQLLLKAIQHEEMSVQELVFNLAGLRSYNAAIKHHSVVGAILALKS